MAWLVPVLTASGHGGGEGALPVCLSVCPLGGARSAGGCVWGSGPARSGPVRVLDARFRVRVVVPAISSFLLHAPLVVNRWLGESPDLTFNMLWPDPGNLSFTGGIDVPGIR